MIYDYERELPRFSVALRHLGDVGVSVFTNNKRFKRFDELFDELDYTSPKSLSVPFRDISRTDALETLVKFAKETVQLKQDIDDRWRHLITETVRRFDNAHPDIPIEAWLYLSSDPITNYRYAIAFYDFLYISRQVVAEEYGEPSHDFTDDSSESLDKFFAELQTITA